MVFSNGFSLAAGGLAPGDLSADASGRAIMATGYFDAATVDDKFIDHAIDTDALALGILAASAAGRALIAAGFFDEATVDSAFAAGSIDGKEIATGQFVQSLIDGVNETITPSYTIAGMSVGDEVIGVIVYTTKASIATQAQRLNSDFTPAAGALTVGANAVDNSANQLLITWMKHQ